MTRFTGPEFSRDQVRRQVRPQPGPMDWQPIFPPPNQLPREEPPRQSRAPTLIALVLLVAAAIVGALSFKHIAAFLATIGQMGQSSEPGDKAIGLAAFGIVLVSILAAMKIAVQYSGRSR